MCRSDTFLCGDANIHGPWDIQKYDPNQSNRLEEYLESTSRMVLNDGRHTLINRRGTSELDITACPLFMTTECSWNVLPLSFSDHFPILTSINTVKQGRKRFGKARWSFKTADWEEFEKEHETILLQFRY